jgi:transcriptional regulator with XRE-family HTH domain
LNSEFTRLLRVSGWKQAEAARRLHLSPATVSLYLSGHTRPSVTVIQLFKLMLGDTSPIPGEPGTDQVEPPPRLPPLEEDEVALLRELRLLDGTDRRSLIHAFRGIAALLPRPGAPPRRARRP